MRLAPFGLSTLKADANCALWALAPKAHEANHTASVEQPLFRMATPTPHRQHRMETRTGDKEAPPTTQPPNMGTPMAAMEQPLLHMATPTPLAYTG